MDKRSSRNLGIRRPVLAALCAAGSLLLVLAIRATVSAGCNFPSLKDTDAAQSVALEALAETETTTLQAGFAHEALPVTDLGIGSKLLSLGTGKVVNILLIGQDAVSDSGARSDTMILCSFNKKNNTITMTSFLRDLYVKIPGHKSNRINAAYRFGGTELLNKTLLENFGIEVDGNIQVDFSCFEEIIDKLGGVTLELTEAEADFINTHMKDSTLTEGTHLLTGAQALMYARNRYDVDGDFSRTNRQRKLLNVLLETYKGRNLPEMLSVIQDIIPMINTDLSKSDLTAYAVSLGPMISSAEIRTQAIPVDGAYYDAKIDGKAVLVPDIPRNVQALEDALA